MKQITIFLNIDLHVDRDKGMFLNPGAYGVKYIVVEKLFDSFSEPDGPRVELKHYTKI